VTAVMTAGGAPAPLSLRLLKYEQILEDLRHELCISSRHIRVPRPLADSIHKDNAAHDIGLNIMDHWHEPYRLKVRFMQVKLRKQKEALLDPAGNGPGPYPVSVFRKDLALIAQSLEETGFKGWRIAGSCAGSGTRSRPSGIIWQRLTFASTVMSLAAVLRRCWMRPV
jgi:hypothetical protein